MLTANDGLFDRTSKASAKYKQESMIEAVKTADLYLEVDMRMPETEKDNKEIGDLLNKLEELGGIKAPEYMVSTPGDNQATIADPKTGVVLDITIDGNNKVIIEPSIVEDVTNLVVPTVDWEINPPKETTAETVTITITITEEKNGIAKIKFQDKEEEILGNVNGSITRRYEVTKNGSYKFMAEGGNGRRITKTIPIDNVKAIISDPIAQVVKVGDYVNYDAGNWTKEDFNLIRASVGKPTVSESKEVPTNNHNQFGGFTIGDSRNKSSKQYCFTYNGITYGNPKNDGWRVWDIDESTGEVTLITAGNPETYCIYYNPASVPNSGTEGVNVLKNRNCKMYENEYAKPNSAKILTGKEAERWYNKNFRTTWVLDEPYNSSNSSKSFYQKTFSTSEPIGIFENGSYYWLASAYNSIGAYYVNPKVRYVDVGYLSGYRGTCSSYFKC